MDKTPEPFWIQDRPLDSRAASKRRGPRMNFRVPVAITWNPGSAGSPRSEEGFTRVVNSYGCLLVSPKEIQLRQRLRVTNLSTRREVDAEWCGRARSARTDGIWA